MEIYTYLLHSGVILALLTLFYWVILSKQTFFQTNRWFLLANIFLALSIPLIPTPTLIHQLKKDIVVSFFSAPDEVNLSAENNISETKSPVIKANESLSNFISKNNTESKITTLTKQPISIFFLLKWVYIVGVLIMLFRFIIQVYYVSRQIKGSEITRGNGYYLATNNQDISPFSFWKYIVLNPNKYNESSFLHILEHERIHVHQRHTFDLVLAELFLIIQWCNPIAWWHRYLVDQNLEFLVDQTLLDNGENKQTYQYHLVQVVVPNSPLSISSNYNSSQLKNRIKMMNTQRSSLASIWKYALFLPIIFFLLLGFTVSSNEIGISTESNSQILKNTAHSSYVIIPEDANEVDLKELQEKLYELGHVLSFDKLAFENDKITELEALLNYGDERGLEIREKWDKETPSPKVALFVNEAHGRFGHFKFDKIILDDLEHKIPQEQIFIAGNFSLSKVLEKMRAQIRLHKQAQDNQFQKDIKNPNWKGKLSKMGTVYGPIITIKNITHIKGLIQKKGYPTTYFLDGIKNDSTVLDIPLNEIERIDFHELRYRKFDKNGKYLYATPWNYEVKVKRKGKQELAPKELDFNESEEIYIILTEESSIENIKQVQEKLLNLGVKLTINNIKYNESGKRIESISVTYNAYENSGTTSWQLSEFFNFIVLSLNPKTGRTSMGINDLSEINEKVKTKNLIIIGQDNQELPIDFLTDKMRINESVAKAKLKNITKEKQRKAKKGYYYFKECDCYIPQTFSPNEKGKTFKIEGLDLNKKSSFYLYNKWGEEVYKAKPYKNDWKGLNNYGKKLKLETHYFIFQADEDLEVVYGQLLVIDEDQEKN